MERVLLTHKTSNEVVKVDGDEGVRVEKGNGAGHRVDRYAMKRTHD